MSINEAKDNIGQMVMSRDPGYWLIREVKTPHGPYLLKKVTKGGMALIERPPEQGPAAVRPSLLSKAND